jgi:signal transduction histidine kinase
VSDLGGTFRIEGKSGKGTRLTIELPLTRRA